MHAVHEIGPPATLAELAQCEQRAGARIPEEYKSSLLGWNGCTVRVVEPLSEDPSREVLRADFMLPDTKQLASTSRGIRPFAETVMFGHKLADLVAGVMSRAITITFHDDVAVLLNANPAGLDDGLVRWVDMAYLGDDSLLPFEVIADSPDDYIEKCFSHLARTLKTEIYWL
jgi:hypothetical protein